MFYPQGELKKQLEQCSELLNSGKLYSREYLLATVDYSSGAFAHYPEYSGDVPGRWIMALVMLEKCGIPQPRLHSMVPEVIGHQCPDGGFHRPGQDITATNRAQIYGNGWMLQGLVDYAEFTGSEAVLSSAVRLGEYYLNTAGYWFSEDEKKRPVTYGHAYGCHSHALAGIAGLYRLTGDERFLTLAGQMVDWADTFEFSCHSHMHLSTLRGMLDLYALTCDGKLLERVKTELEKVEATELLPGGGIYECYGIHYGDEECSTADYMLCNLKLWQVTGEDRYRERTELTYRNYQQFARMDCGLWGSMPVNGEFLVKSDNPAYWCCAMFGSYVQARIPYESVRIVSDTVYIDFIFPCRIENIEIETDFPLGDRIRVDNPKQMKLIIAPPLNCSIDAGGENSYTVRRHFVTEFNEKIMASDQEYNLLLDARFFNGPELLACSKPMLKRRGHYLILPIVNRQGNTASYMRITGAPFRENLVSSADIYQTRLVPLSICGNDPCKAVFDAVEVR